MKRSGKTFSAICEDVRRRTERLPYVSRGGIKLAGALDHFQIDVKDCIAFDVGASTGGFTDCLLKHGAKKVYALDVGYGQLALSLQRDARVVVLDRMNIRTLSPDALQEPVSLVTLDVSFTSLTTMLVKLVPVVSNTAMILALVKPQFELPKEDVAKGGVVRDPTLHQKAIDGVVAAGLSLGWKHLGTSPSVILGAKGNQEFFVAFRIKA